MPKPSLVAAVVAGVVALALSSCSDQEPGPSAADTEATPSATTEASSPSVSTSAPSSSSAGSSTAPDESAPAATLSVTERPTATMTAAPAPGDVAAMLLPADRMGKLNAEWTWSAGNDFTTEPANLTACHRVELQVIGADKVAVREYTSRLDAAVRAHHLVAAFPDDVTARRAYAVLQSWRDGCRKRLEDRAKGGDGVKVSPAEAISTGAEAASSYVVFQPTATGVSRIDNVASALDGNLVHLVVVRVEGNDFNYPRGGTPAAVGVRNATGRSG